MKITSSEVRRQLNDLALEYGRSLASRQTGFLHLCHERREEEPHLTIPVIENLLYALALFRSRTVEHVGEGKLLLEKLLGFQNHLSESSDFGNFPVYLHEYPACRDRTIAVHAAFLLLALLKEFSSILSPLFVEMLSQAVKSSLQYAWSHYQSRLPPCPLAIKLAAASIALNQVRGDPSFLQQGENALVHILNEGLSHELLYCPAHLGSALCSLGLIERGDEKAWKPLQQFAQEAWHPELCCYIGPAYREWQVGLEPQPTLYDLYMSCATGKLSPRLSKRASVHLEALLIPFAERMMQPPASSPIEGFYKTSLLGYGLLGATTHVNPIWEKGYHPFRLLWGSAEQVHSLVCQQGGCYPQIEKKDDRRIDFIYSLGMPESGDEKERREIIFYLDAGEEREFLVSGERSSTFRLGETVSICGPQLTFQFQFFLEEGEGKFLGHRMLGNRPSQLEVKGQKRFHAYDWVLFLRTVDREQPCRLRVALTILCLT
jgi:hypothetical protein